jgi:hypothetical protein
MEPIGSVPTNPGIEIEELEATRIYRALFRQNPPAMITARFKPVSKRLNERASRADLERYTRAVRQSGDLEALELACRLAKKMPLLSWKFQAMVYLAETLPENQAYFVNERTSFFKAGWLILLDTLWTGFKAARGFWLLARLKDA